jgi:hypothetical protein
MLSCVLICTVLLQLAWRPCQLDAIVRSAVPFVLQPNWQPCGGKEMLVLQVKYSLCNIA